MTDFLFAVPSGEPVSLEPFHFCMVGQTQFSGKTTLIRRLGEWAIDLGYRILVFDTKETEADYAGFGQETQVCLRETTDSFVLIGLLESMFRRRLTPYYATLSRLTEAARGFDDIIGRARDLETRTKSSWLKDACRVLYDLLERLQNETAKVETVPQLRLNDGINRMDINQFSLEAQQLVVKNSFEDALRIYKRNLILVIDEAFKFIPQGYSSAATRAIMNVMTQGAKTGLFGWISTQFLAVTDKDPLKACAVKFLGTQDHTTEIKHTLDLIPEVRGKYGPDNIMKLKLGHWILVRKRPMFVGIVYATPAGVPESVGVEVAQGKRSPESVRDEFLKVKVMEDEEMYRKMWEEEKRKREQLEKDFADIRTRIYQELKAEFEKEVDLKAKEKIDKTLQEIAERFVSREELLAAEQKIEKLEKEKAELLEDLSTYENLDHALERLIESKLPKQVTTSMPTSVDVPSEIAVAVEQPAITIKVERRPVTLTDKTTEGKIAIVYAKGRLPSDKWFTTTDVINAFTSEGWPRDPRVGPTLDLMCQWGFFEKHYAGKRPEYRIRMSPEDARSKNLLKEVEA